MTIRTITSEDKSAFNAVVHHPLQSYEWGEFREKTGLSVIRRGVFDEEKVVDAYQMTLHPIPKLPFTIGYVPKAAFPTSEILRDTREQGRANNAIFVQLEPNVHSAENSKLEIRNSNLFPAAHPLFTKYTFVLDLTPSEDVLLQNMHSKTRYNIRVAQKRGVSVTEDNSEKAFKRYLELTQETTTRQKFYAHTKRYHSLQWETLQHTVAPNTLSSHLLTATYEGEILVTWIVFIFQDTLYYPYGASSSEHREVMASNIMMWEAIRFGKAHNLKKFDMWGALGPEPDTNDPWFGFHRFKQGYGPEHVEFVGSFDLPINQPLYQLYKVADKARWLILSLKR